MLNFGLGWEIVLLESAPLNTKANSAVTEHFLCAFLMGSWRQGHFELSPSRRSKGSFPILITSACSCGPFLPWLTFGETHPCFGRDAQLLGVPLGSDLKVSTASLILGFNLSSEQISLCSRDILRCSLKLFVLLQRLRGLLSPFPRPSCREGPCEEESGPL